MVLSSGRLACCGNLRSRNEVPSIGNPKETSNLLEAGGNFSENLTLKPTKTVRVPDHGSTQ